MVNRPNYNSLQKTVDETVRMLGGYWIPLSGLARVLEELGELGELILKKDFSVEFATELSDIQIITICVANQYCSRIDISKFDYPTDYTAMSLQDLYLKLASDCGEFARIVNLYEGNKKLKPTENPTTVEKQASLISFDIFLIAKRMDLNLEILVKETMQKVKKRDKNRFDVLYDPSLSLSHDEYLALIKPKKKVWGLRDSSSLSLEDDLTNNTDTLQRFLKFGKVEGIELLVLKIPTNINSYKIGLPDKYNTLLSVTRRKDFIVITQNN